MHVATIVCIQIDVQSTRVRSYRPWYAPKLSLNSSSSKFVLEGTRVHPRGLEDYTPMSVYPVLRRCRAQEDSLNRAIDTCSLIQALVCPKA